MGVRGKRGRGTKREVRRQEGTEKQTREGSPQFTGWSKKKRTKLMTP